MNNLIKQDQDRLKLFKSYGYDISRARNFILIKAKVLRGKILEVGTGRGNTTVALAKKGFRIVSIDLDKIAQNIARVKLKNLKIDKKVSLKIMNAEKLRYQDNYFDYVVSVNFIHHADNPAKCLKEMIRVAKNKIVIADLNNRGKEIMEKVHALDGHRHAVSKMSPAEIKKYLEKQGLLVKAYRDVCQTVIVAKKGE
jgi:ubiquinone/menaquinone biosynthesis C-methylase UbiE